MRHVALVTYKENNTLSESDSLLVAPLEKEGFLSIAAPWDDPTIDWKKFDAIILRSCWNYYTNYEVFLKWLFHLKHIGATVLNPIHLALWNSKKTYLLDLQKKNIPIIPTIYRQANIHSIHSYTGWNDIITKPVVGARSYKVYRFNNPASWLTQLRFQLLAGNKDCLIQPFMPQIQTDGEYSFIFIGGIFSHAVQKKQGISLIKPSQLQIRQARRVLKAIRTDTLYARVDGLYKNGAFVLLEMELIEPILYFDLYPQAATTFAKALIKRL